jgi:hypothetical protein
MGLGKWVASKISALTLRATVFVTSSNEAGSQQIAFGNELGGFIVSFRGRQFFSLMGVAL